MSGRPRLAIRFAEEHDFREKYNFPAKPASEYRLLGQHDEDARYRYPARAALAKKIAECLLDEGAA
jgi:hypothetical protein